MILEKQTEATVLSEGQSQGSIGMSLDLDSAQILMQMLSKNLYSDAIGSTIREWTSNALDSHRRCGETKPIVVGLNRNKQDNYEFTVEDFGTGLDADDVENVISKYGKSTKRNTNNELGMFGLGFKAGLAYGSSFYFVCRKNGIERKYMMYEGEEVNTIDLLYEQATQELNGVKMILPVKHTDRRDFISKMKIQLAYFENVYFDVNDGDIKNNFTIYRGEDFQYSELISDSSLHLCLDNVYYPLDFQKLGINKINFPLALRFSLNEGLTPIPNREQLMYSRETKDVILAKISKVADFFAERYNLSVTTEADIFTIMEFYSSNRKPVQGFTNGLVYEFNELKSFSTIKLLAPKLPNVKLLDLELIHRNRDFILGEYKQKYFLRNGTLREAKHSYQSDISINDVKKDVYYIYSDKISGIKKEWLKSLPNSYHGNNYNVCLIKKEKKLYLGNVNRTPNYNTYASICNLKSFKKSQWRDVIKEFQYIQSLYISKFIDLDKLDVPQEYLDQRKAAKDAAKIKLGLTPGKRRVKLQGEITGKQACQLERFVSGKNAKFVSETYQLKDFHQRKFLTVYGTSEDVETLDKLFIIFKKTIFIQFSDRELKRLEGVEIHNLMPLNKFMKGDNKVFRRVATAELIRIFKKKYSNTFEKRDRLEGVSNDLCKKLRVLNDYEYKYRDSNANKETLTAILEIATNNKMFDEHIKLIYDEVKVIFEKLPFIESLFSEINSWSRKKENGTDNMTEVISSLFKYHRQKIDWKNYKTVIINDDVIVDENAEELIEEDVTDLLDND